jgi:hypothetical protein
MHGCQGFPAPILYISAANEPPISNRANVTCTTLRNHISVSHSTIPAVSKRAVVTKAQFQQLSDDRLKPTANLTKQCRRSNSHDIRV